MQDIRVIMNGEAPVVDYGYPSMRRVKAFIAEHTGYDELKGRACLRIVEGFVIGLYNIANVGFEAV